MVALGSISGTTWSLEQLSELAPVHCVKWNPENNINAKIILLDALSFSFPIDLAVIIFSL